jgi:multimeric flavodoxin WrbA
MNVIAFNGSPRENWNTAILLNKVLEGAASQEATTKLIHLYKLNYKGCSSCFSCKRKGSKSYGKCAMNDDLTPILRTVEEADVIVLGSPIYLGTASGEMRSFLERLVYPYLVYDESRSSLFKKKISTGFIYTMGLNTDGMIERGYEQQFKATEMLLERIFGASEYLCVTDTYQFDDYSKYVATAFKPEEKAKKRNEEFPKDCQKAYDMGVRLTQQS